MSPRPPDRRPNDAPINYKGKPVRPASSPLRKTWNPKPPPKPKGGK